MAILDLNLFAKATVKQLGSQLVDRQDYVDTASLQEDLYKSPCGYLPWNIHLRTCFLSGSVDVTIAGYKNGDVLAVKVGELARDAILSQAPARYISKELCEAFMETPIPVLPREILSILPYVHIMLPRNFVFDHMNDEVVSLIVKTGCLYPENIPHESLGREIMKEFFPNDIVTPRELLGSSGIQVATITPGGSNFWQEFVDEHAKSWQNEHIKQREKSGYDNKATEAIMRIAINSLLVHLYEPELITTDSKPKIASGTGFSKREEKSPLGATWIGKTFRYQREKTGSPSRDDQGRSGIRAHWRRGHWHTVLHGKGRQERRVQWFKPVFVAAGAV